MFDTAAGSHLTRPYRLVLSFRGNLVARRFGTFATLSDNSGNRVRRLLDQIAGAARREAASLWHSCFAEAVDIQSKPQ